MIQRYLDVLHTANKKEEKYVHEMNHNKFRKTTRRADTCFPEL